ncbi:MAG: hypothetical protein MUF04_06530 [Akkermansiaceae bacterium]|nr:hypothetical protein [Akkermansiaceae bacterium]
MKQRTTLLSAIWLFGSFAMAGEMGIEYGGGAMPSADGFDQARRPISNPTLFDLALPGTNIHPIFMYQNMPDSVSLANGPNLGLGGDFQLYALQFEIAVNERFSIVATKDGYIDFNPGQKLSDASGWANLGGGVKYAFVYDPVQRLAVSGTATLELPTGNTDVFQGEGDGLLNLIVSAVKLYDNWQFAGALGWQAPFSSEQSHIGWLSAHASYDMHQYFVPLVELNWFHTMDAGSGTRNFNEQLGGAVPGAVAFEGGDLINLGARNATISRDIVTAAFGFRSRLTSSLDLGFAYELPLTDEDDGLMENRFTLDMVWRF